MTDSLPALALADEPIEQMVMKRPPVPRGANIITKLMLVSIGIHTVILTAIVLGTYFWGLQHFTGVWDGQPAKPDELLLTSNSTDDEMKALEAWEGNVAKQVRQAQTMVMFIIVFAELLRGYTCRSLTASLWSLGVFTNKWMQYSVIGSIGLTFLVGVIPGVQNIFGMEMLDGSAWGWVIGFSLLPAILDELIKFVYRQLGYGDVQVVEGHANSKVSPLHGGNQDPAGNGSKPNQDPAGNGSKPKVLASASTSLDQPIPTASVSNEKNDVDAASDR
jgi:Ca2+-transporting ATPase